MSRYARLRDYLTRQAGAECRMAFAEVEQVLGFSLPASARDHSAWWSNHADSHSHARAWRDAGWKTTQVDRAHERITFVRDAAGSVRNSRSAPTDAISLVLTDLSRTAIRMIDDYAEGAGVTRSAAAIAMLDALAEERRRKMLENLAVARMPAGSDSTDDIRADRDDR